MTTHTIALAINTTIPAVGALLAKAGINLGPVTSQTGQLRTFNITSGHLRVLPPAGLTDRDRKILRAYAEDLSHKQVGALFGKSESAAKSFSKPLFRKLDAADRAEAVAIAYRTGVLSTWEVTA